MKSFFLLIATALLALGGCTGTGTWMVETWGEEYIEEGIPAAEFADGGSVMYTEFLVVISGVALVDGDGEVVAEGGDPAVFDVTAAGPHPVTEADVPATHYDRVDFTVAPASGAVAGNASDDQVAAMNDGGWSVSATGTAAIGGDIYAFEWDFDSDTTYACEPDLTLPADGEGSTQLTIHGDHLFYDDLEDPDAEVRLQTLVDADADADGVLTRAELEAVDIASTGYGVGQQSQVTDLWGYVEHLTRTLGHIDGEGHCQVDF